MPGKPKRPGGHGYGRRSRKCIGRRFKSSQQESTVLEENVLDDHDKVISLIILNAHSYLCNKPRVVFSWLGYVVINCVANNLNCDLANTAEQHIMMPL